MSRFIGATISLAGHANSNAESTFPFHFETADSHCIGWKRRNGGMPDPLNGMLLSLNFVPRPSFLRIKGYEEKKRETQCLRATTHRFQTCGISSRNWRRARAVTTQPSPR